MARNREDIPPSGACFFCCCCMKSLLLHCVCAGFLYCIWWRLPCVTVLLSSGAAVFCAGCVAVCILVLCWLLCSCGLSDAADRSVCAWFHPIAVHTSNHCPKTHTRGCFLFKTKTFFYIAASWWTGGRKRQSYQKYDIIALYLGFCSTALPAAVVSTKIARVVLHISIYGAVIVERQW